jgi:hypothetical protein
MFWLFLLLFVASIASFQQHKNQLPELLPKLGEEKCQKMLEEDLGRVLMTGLFLLGYLLYKLFNLIGRIFS